MNMHPKNIIGKMVKCTIDRPYGSIHPLYKNIVYELNYGYVNGVFSGDGEEQDVYVMGIKKPIAVFSGRVIAVYHRFNDVEDKWIVATDDIDYSKTDILKAIDFQERYNPGVLYM